MAKPLTSANPSASRSIPVCRKKRPKILRNLGASITDEDVKRDALTAWSFSPAGCAMMT